MQIAQAARKFPELGHGLILQILLVKSWMGELIPLKSWKSSRAGAEGWDWHILGIKKPLKEIPGRAG